MSIQAALIKAFSRRAIKRSGLNEDQLVRHLRKVFNNPAHPYTQALIASVPKMKVQVDRLHTIEGQPPEFSDMPQGCRFAPRCALADDHCRTAYPPTYTVGTEHTANCWKLEESA